MSFSRPTSFRPYYHSLRYSHWMKDFLDKMLEIVPHIYSAKERGAPYYFDEETQCLMFTLKDDGKTSLKFDCDSLYRPHMEHIDRKKAMRGFLKFYILCLNHHYKFLKRE